MPRGTDFVIELLLFVVAAPPRNDLDLLAEMMPRKCDMMHSVAHLCVYTPLAKRGAGMTLHGHRHVMAQFLLRCGSRAARPCYLLGPIPPQAWPNLRLSLKKCTKRILSST